jgi:PhnB protein
MPGKPAASAGPVTRRAVQPIPERHHTVTPHLIVADTARALDFYARAFGAIELGRCEMPDGGIGHAEIRIGDSLITLADEFPDWGYLGPNARGGSTVVMRVYVEDVDAAFARAIAAGGTVLRPVTDQFYGDRSGTLTDPFGHVWTLATHVEDVPPDELARRMAKLFGT